MQAMLSAWATKDLPARLDVMATAKLLGFGEQDIQILMAARKLLPLGDPAPNAPKWFAAIEIIRLAADKDWLNKATKELSKYWKHKRERRGIPRRAIIKLNDDKVSPKSSPEVSPKGQLRSNERAIASDERAVQESA
jgi:hypothetical protein